MPTLSSMFTRADWNALMGKLAVTAAEAITSAYPAVFDDMDLSEPVSLVLVRSPDGVTVIVPYIGDALDQLVLKANATLHTAWTSANPTAHQGDTG